MAESFVLICIDESIINFQWVSVYHIEDAELGSESTCVEYMDETAPEGREKLRRQGTSVFVVDSGSLSPINQVGHADRVGATC